MPAPVKARNLRRRRTTIEEQEEIAISGESDEEYQEVEEDIEDGENENNYLMDDEGKSRTPRLAFEWLCVVLKCNVHIKHTTT